jgi:hypothetical protein
LLTARQVRALPYIPRNATLTLFFVIRTLDLFRVIRSRRHDVKVNIDILQDVAIFVTYLAILLISQFVTFFSQSVVPYCSTKTSSRSSSVILHGYYITLRFSDQPLDIGFKVHCSLSYDFITSFVRRNTTLIWKLVAFFLQSTPISYSEDSPVDPSQHIATPTQCRKLLQAGFVKFTPLYHAS